MLSNQKLQLRHYQKNAVNSCIGGENINGILVLPTGTGKSIIVSELAHNFQNEKVLVLQPSKEILEQNFEKYSLYADDGAIYSASLNQKNIDRITFATIGSIIKLDRKTLQEFTTLIIDECHLVAQSGKYQQIIDIINPKRLIGLTATPYRNNSKFGGIKYEMLTRKRDPIFKTILYKYQIQECVKDGYWCPITYFMPIDYNTDGIEKRGSEYKDEAVSQYNFSIKLHENFINIVNQSNKKHFLVFLTTIKECQHTEEILKNAGITCRAIHSKLHKRDREDILKDFKSGKIKVVLNVGVLTTGFDFPELDCLILARPTMSLSLYYQMLGRGVRIHRNKRECDIYDLCGNVKSFGRIETLQFVGDDNRRLGLTSDKQTLIKPPKSFMQKVFSKEIQSTQVGDLILKTGKYAGKTVDEIYNENKQYITWNIENNTSYKPIFEKYLLEIQWQAKQLNNF